MLNKLIDIFQDANQEFMRIDYNLFLSRVSERSLCGALMMHLKYKIADSIFSEYKVDVEYNRNCGGKLKTYAKTISGPEYKVIRISCDLIVHSRGQIPCHDNLIAIEMKKAHRPQKEKDSDRERLVALTKDSFDDIWSFDGKTLPEHVCRYSLGVYYEIDYKGRMIIIEYYTRGELFKKYTIDTSRIFEASDGNAS